MKMIGTLKELRSKINNGDIQTWISCSNTIDESGYIRINAVSRDWWVTTGQGLSRRTFSCCPGTSAYSPCRKESGEEGEGVK